jgi:hypothetical protein
VLSRSAVRPGSEGQWGGGWRSRATLGEAANYLGGAQSSKPYLVKIALTVPSRSSFANESLILASSSPFPFRTAIPI